MTQLRPSEGIAVITGAGSGLGRAMAVELTRRGFTVAGLGRRRAALEETRARAEPGRFHLFACDVSNPAEVDQAFARVRAELGPVVLLINNAASYPRRDILDESATSFMQTVATNLGGTIACSRAALQDMVESGRGRILNVATFADLAPLPAASAYSVSKGAARIFTRALIADLSDRFPQIVIGDWMPGMLNTAMGIPDGIAPEQAARWGVALALDADPALTGAVFEMDREVLPPRGVKGKLKDALRFQRRRARRITL
ncbi:SDR family oxidoreductase [Salipiger sp. PrR002]|uniref:SDR family oxidoreductase n=1 Tax=Salipiger sp. PrR002 TaxID=2706489 RepID=UPI0013BCC5B1|nr:SDR family NAD(P)-dependent oxidoreductase [Salipiger sp. PrR002]NDV98288.1 SDR family oxidoreductase [Salipiger sp. PrR002]NDW55000.1 SDR family oxidoreductase [Salipiger sp. PrR004]